MSLFLRLGRLCLPPPVKRKRLRQLFALTADAFGRSTPVLEGMSPAEILERYARFTMEQAERVIERPEERERVKERLYRNAFTLGQELKKRFRIRSRRDALRMGRIVYRALKIDFHGDGARGIVIRRCFFSTYYSAGICALISALDEGLMAGLTSGLRLQFIERITEGKECCRASLGFEGDPS